jgi:arginase
MQYNPSTMQFTLIEVPYDSGRFGERMGRGPTHLLERGLGDRLRGAGHEIAVENVRLPDGLFPSEVAAAVALHGAVAEAVRRAKGAGSLPVVLTGNCNYAACGVRAGLDGDLGVLWLDAHADWNTPDTSPSGFLDGMAVALLTGESYGAAMDRVPGFVPLPPEHVAFVGCRDLDPAEHERLSSLGERWIRTEDARARGLAGCLDAALAGLPSPLYLHADLDVLDVSEARINQYSSPGGLTRGELLALADHLAHRKVAAVALSAYDPACSRDDESVVEIAARFLDRLATNRP